MKTFFKPTFCRTILLLCFCFFSHFDARAQITQLTADGKNAIVHFYFRPFSMAQARDVTVTYHINGHTGYITNVTETETFFGMNFFHFTIQAPYDATHHCLTYPIIFYKGNISWREGLISNHKSNYQAASFYGDAFICMELYYEGVSRFDVLTLDPDAEEMLMYEFNPNTGLSRRLDLNSNGQSVWTLNTQDFCHVGNKSYDMNHYPVDSKTIMVQKETEGYKSEVVLVRKCAYDSYRTTKANGATVGGLKQRFGTDEDLRGNDVFHACLPSSSKQDADVTFSTLREVGVTSWPTNCNTTRSCIVYSDPLDEDNDGDNKLVGHLSLTLMPKTKKWMAESWVEFKNDPDTHPDGWATFSTPYDVRVPGELLVVAAKTLETDNVERENRIVLQSMSDCRNIPANTGVILMGTGTFHFMPADASTLAADRAEYAGVGNLMKYVALNKMPNDVTNGIDINSLPYSCNDGTHYLLTYNTTENKPKFVKAVKNSPVGDAWDDTDMAGHIPAFKSYLCVPGVSYARELGVVWDNQSNGISTVSEDASHTTAAYDLQGRRYDSSRTLQRGLYIINGKKYIKH